MANEKRLIDANGCAKYIVRRMGFNPANAEQVLEYMAEYFEQNAVDAVGVVRCKDCKWYKIRKWDDNKPEYDCRKTHALLDVKPDDFCSYGERKDNGKE
jgi:hypothetical protein